ncbi:Cof-type HAD-IIB family hydrolase [Clostridium sp. AL.422]|uniref:Cof-type HAD-IIB family hydrolase n=1 Tax=Clostridium TaxID=1485 RepID=UPI00293DCDD4|nr:MULTISPECIES: Cof-type HAD-IIB family hydrolase [unclassified Clostridium]MDV4151871.1 Cof-type HAD-IIB family hydrolase [Clostridium sp. AL.422]
MTYKMVCIDMDGTLLGKRKRISKESKEVIKKIHNKGVEIVVTTGRIYNNAAYYSHLLGVESPVIAANGAIVRDKHSNKVIYENPIKTEVCIKLIELLYKMDFFFHFYTLDGIYCGDKITKFGTKLYMTKQAGYENLKIKYYIISKLEEWKEFFKRTNGQITKCIAFSLDPDKIDKLKKELNEFKDIVYFGAGSRSIEINHKGVSKGRAVKALADYYGIKREEIVCIGDNENDISMIEYAGLGVAMGNAIDQVKALADYITDSNKEEGVSNALKKIFNV